MIDVEILTRAGCKLCDDLCDDLCDEMKQALEQAATGLDVQLRETDIDPDENLTARYENDIPVLFVNGHKAFKHRATVQELKKRLLMADG